MNTGTGEVLDREVLAQLASKGDGVASARYRSSFDPIFKPIDPANLSDAARAQLAAHGITKIGRNSPCPCGSRKRFKKCCMTTR